MGRDSEDRRSSRGKSSTTRERGRGTRINVVFTSKRCEVRSQMQVERNTQKVTVEKFDTGVKGVDSSSFSHFRLVLVWQMPLPAAPTGRRDSRELQRLLSTDVPE